MLTITGILIVLSSLGAISLFAKSYKYVRLCHLSLWGVALFIDYLFPALGAGIASVLNLPIDPIISLFSELLSLFIFGIILTIYSHRKLVSNTVLWLVFVFFCVLWLSEFSHSLNPTGIANFKSFYYAPIFNCIAVVTGVLIYWLSIFQSNQLFFRKDPFFWLSLGWFIFFLVTSTSFIPIIQKSEFINKVMLSDVSVAGTLANICYMIAFLKTKNWVIKGYITKT